LKPVKVIVTCGPSYEPIDEVRRITNFSTGELGILLANALAQAGHDVICLKGAGATCPRPLSGARLMPFTTNEDLRAKLIAEADHDDTGAVFHAAALCDYKARQVTGNDGEAPTSAKISSRQGPLTLILEPLPKLITELRALFPGARIVGWKYELEGGRDDALAAGLRQMEEAATDACVVNGAAFGPGFGFCERDAAPIPFADKTQLCQGLAQWLERTETAKSSPRF
jgi:phosphopantothenoylcysteine synthetase/decarboxylase